MILDCKNVVSWPTAADVVDDLDEAASLHLVSQRRLD